MSNDYGSGGYPGNTDANQGQGYPPQNYQPQGSYPPPPQYPPQPQAYPPPPPQYAAPDDYARYPQQGYGAPPPPPVVPVSKGRGPLPFIVAIVVIAALAVGGYFLWQNVGKPLIAGVAYDKLLPNTTMAYVSYNATPSQDQQANWAKIRDAFTSQPGVQDKLNQLGAQAGMAPMMLSSFISQCSTSNSSASSGGSIVSNLGGFLSGNVTLAYLQPSDAEVQKVIKDAISSSGMMSGMGSRTTMTNLGTGTTAPPATSNNGANSQQATCEAFNLVENHMVAVVELDVNPLDPNSIIARLQQKTNDKNKGSLTKDETYNGSDIYKINLDSTTGSASTFYGLLIGKEGILSSNKDSLKAVVDAYKDGSKSLSSNAQYIAALAKLPTDRSMTLYMDNAKFAGTVSAAIDEAAKDSPMMGSSFKSTKGMYDQMKNGNTISVVGVTARPNGVQLDSAGNIADSATTLSAAMPMISDRNIVKMMPADTWAFFASADLKDLVTQGLTYLDKMNYFSSMGMGNMNAAQLKQQFKQATGLDLDSDILSWMGGEWGMYIQPGADASTPAQGGFVLNVKDSKAQATTSIHKINQAIKDKLLTGSNDSSDYAPKLTEEQVAGSKVYKFGSMSSAVYYGIVGDYFFITSNTATMQAIASGKGGVTDSANYKGAMTNALTNNNAIMYVNVQAIREAVEKMMNLSGGSTSSTMNYDKDIKPFLVPFHSLGITEDNANGLQHSVLFVDIEK